MKTPGFMPPAGLLANEKQPGGGCFPSSMKLCL